MQTDRATHLLLAGILVCLIVLVAQGFMGDPGGEPREIAAPEERRQPAATVRPEPRRPVLQATDSPAGAPQRARPQEAHLESFARALRAGGKLPSDIRVWAATQLGEIDDERSTEALLEVLADEDARVVAAAVTAVGPRDDERIPPALRGLRAHPDPGVQAALAALAEGE